VSFYVFGTKQKQSPLSALHKFSSQIHFEQADIPKSKRNKNQFSHEVFFPSSHGHQHHCRHQRDQLSRYLRTKAAHNRPNTNANCFLFNEQATTNDLNIQVSCANIHFDEISPKALAFGAKALEVSFNKVHDKTDGMSLAKVIATPNGASFAANNQKSVESKKGVRGTATKDLKHCKLCANDDDAVSTNKESLYFAAQATEKNLKHCKLCANDDDAAILLDDDKLKLWEGELSAIFAMSPYDSLSKAEDCSITMAPRATVSAIELHNEQQAVTIDIECDKLDFSSAPVRVLSAASKALVESFDAVHSTEGNTLSTVFLAAPRLSFSDNADNKSVKHCKLCANDDDDAEDAWVIQEPSVGHCKLCANDDFKSTTDYAIEFSAIKHCKLCASDDATILHVSETAVNHAWEQLFLAKMMKEGLNPGSCKFALSNSAMA
jgi:hypothetical protein